MSAGDAFTCGVKIDGTIACWGQNTWGEATPPAGTFTSVSAGEAHACGVRIDGTIACWGNKNCPQVPVPAGTFVSVNANNNCHACGVETDGTVTCWGNCQSSCTPPTGAFASVCSSDDSGMDLFTCGVRIRRDHCLLGSKRIRPNHTAGRDLRVRQRGRRTRCGMGIDGTVTCWGDNSWGQATPPGGTFTSVSAGDSFTCGVKIDGPSPAGA